MTARDRGVERRILDGPDQAATQPARVGTTTNAIACLDGRPRSLASLTAASRKACNGQERARDESSEE